ncbi:MAG TPA: type VI secretion system tube protein TssD [Edaphobacter sp.]|nr:type VI secretion system tube protein TssD [Edaphobacter sp.]
MAVQIYAAFKGVKQGDFKSESNQKDHEGTVPGVAFSYGVIVPRDVATGQASGKRQHQPVVFTKEWGASSPQFYTAAYTNEVLSAVAFNFYVSGPTGTQQLDHTVKLTNATIISVKQSIQLPQQGGPIIDSRELEEISLIFQKIEITSISGGTTATDNWNLAV